MVFQIGRSDNTLTGGWPRNTRKSGGKLWHASKPKPLWGGHLNPKKASNLRRLSRTEVKTRTEVLIGHGNLVYYRHKMGLAESLLCRLCGEDNEISTLILRDYIAIRDKRQILTGCFSIDVAVIQTKSGAQVLALWHGLWGHT